MQLYNTKTRQLDEVTPLKTGQVTLYSCGPTVYDYPHIGNWRAFLFYDTLVRTLETDGYSVNQVLNITDVGHLVSDADEGEDKLQKAASKQEKTAWDIAEFYTTSFFEGIKQLNITPAHCYPKATDHIQEQIELVQRLEKKGATYKIDDGIYFDTSLFPDYGPLTGQSENDTSHERIAHNDQKRQPSDFALWKFSPKDEQRDMEWDSPWGKGFPGWHIECSAMAIKYLGETIDIHTGGIDHTQVHHPNEIAQSETATGKPFAHIWAHNEFILVDGKKMSKSLGNFYTLDDIIKKGFDPLAFRLLVLQSHYRHQMNFTWEALEAAQNRLHTLRNFAVMRYQASASGVHLNWTDSIKTIKECMLSDLNSPNALSALAQQQSKVDDHPLHEDDVSAFEALLSFLDALFGLGLCATMDITAEQKALIQKREEARQAKRFEDADAIREALLEQGVVLKDTPQGAIWQMA